jgi:hypothetical protein
MDDLEGDHKIENVKKLLMSLFLSFFILHSFILSFK